MTRRHLASWLCVALLLAAPPAAACTTFSFRSHRVMGKSYDWHTADGLLLVNARGLAKRALVLGAGRARAAHWKARYGSVTFNQYGRGLPNGGINERGLAVEVMWLAGARYGALRAHEQTINELSFIQYLLDMAANVDQAVRLARRLRIVRAYARVHYLACDAGGHCAAIEHLGGELVVHRGRSLPRAALTNDTYADALAHARRVASHPAGSSSLARFVRAAAHVRQERSRARAGAVARAFATLDAVRAGSYSKWQIVYELTARRVSFRLAGGAARRRFSVDLARIDFRCGRPLRAIDLTGALDGEPGRWIPSTSWLERRLVTRTLGRLRLPEALISGIVAYGHSMRCTPRSLTR